MKNPTPPSEMTNKQLASECLRRWGLRPNGPVFSDWDFLLEAALRMLQLEKKELDFLMEYSHFALLKEKAPIRAKKETPKVKGQLFSNKK